MSLEDMTRDEFIAEMRASVQRELDKKPLISPTYDSGHIVIAYQAGMKDAEARIIKLLEDNCECMFEINKYYSGCHNHKLIALIKGKAE